MTLQEAYQILGVPRNAGPADVKSAYRSRVSVAHPDHGGATADFIRVRAAYEIVSTFLHEPVLEDEAPIPADLRSVIENVVREFRQHQAWADEETARHMRTLHSKMSSYLSSASRAELRQFSTTFRNSWDASIDALFEKCNTRCDDIIQDYEGWYTANTQAVYDDLYRRELVRFAWRRRFWEAFLFLGALAGALTVVVGWESVARRSVSAVLILVAFVLAFFIHRWSARRERKRREKREPLSIVPFAIHPDARFQGERALRKGRRTTAAFGVAGLFLGNAASAGFAVPMVGAVAGAALGGALDRLLNPTDQMRESMGEELRRFMAVATPQVRGYVIEAHEQMLAEVREQIINNYRERMRGTVDLLTAGEKAKRPNDRGVTAAPSAPSKI